MLILDEAWVFLDSLLFAARIREWLKTLRKKNVAVVFATQSLADIAHSDIAPALVESCPTRLYLPNERAFEPQQRRAYEGSLDKYNHSLTEQEIRKGLSHWTTKAGKAAAQTMAWLRTTNAAAPQASSLAAAVRRALPKGNVLVTNVEPQAGGGLAPKDRAAFVRLLTEKLKAAIDEHVTARGKHFHLAPYGQRVTSLRGPLRDQTRILGRREV